MKAMDLVVDLISSKFQLMGTFASSAVTFPLAVAEAVLYSYLELQAMVGNP